MIRMEGLVAISGMEENEGMSIEKAISKRLLCGTKFSYWSLKNIVYKEIYHDDTLVKFC